MTVKADFLKAIREKPEDDAPRLMFADWLMENSQSEWGEFIILQCDLAKTNNLVCARVCSCGGRFMPMPRGMRSELSVCAKCKRDGPPMPKHTGSYNPRLAEYCSDPSCKLCVARIKEHELYGPAAEEMLKELPMAMLGLTASPKEYDMCRGSFTGFLYRGFVDKVCGGYELIYRHLADIQEHHPVAWVEFDDVPQVTFGPIIGGIQHDERNRRFEYRGQWWSEIGGERHEQNLSRMGSTFDLHHNQFWQLKTDEMVARARTPIGWFESKFPGVRFTEPDGSDYQRLVQLARSPGRLQESLVLAAGRIYANEQVSVAENGMIKRHELGEMSIGVAMEQANGYGDQIRVRILEGQIAATHEMRLPPPLPGIDTRGRIEAMNRAIQAGVAIPQQYIRDTLGIPEPSDE